MITILIDLQYLAPIITYKNSIKAKYIILEQYERWQKMSFRNRCTIASSNGLIDLSIPIAGGRNIKEIIKDVKIDNMKKWQMIHWRGITSAYNRSPWFEFYAEELLKFYNTRYTYLWDWNTDLMYWVLEKLNLDLKVIFTEHFEKHLLDNNITDYRNEILPKNILNYAGDCPVYKQVFENQLGFQPNLSIIDLLFCEGINAAKLLNS
ncbi:MAG: WbqC family protein [Bacteroidetes bacterium]|nr:WbqC family protein [Bacteroidota bacterium]